MDYKEKLRQFNSTEKYKSELAFVRKLINCYGDELLDYGCGIGTFLNTNDDYCGFDVNDYYEGEGMFYLNELPVYPFGHITMIHSIAHIPNPIEVLKDLKQRYNATVTVITPNAYWLMLQSNNEYKPDETVVKHYTQTQLRELFEEAGYKVTLCGQFGAETTGVNERIFLQAI